MAWALLKPAGEAAGRPRAPEFGVWALALLVGSAAALVVSLMRTVIAWLEFLLFRAPRGQLDDAVTRLVWWEAILAPVVGGLIVSLLLLLGARTGWGPSPRPFGIEHLVRARRMRMGIRLSTLSLKDAFLSALVSTISLGAGASGGRECPSMHVGASLGLLPARLFGFDVATRRVFLGMGAAAGFAAALAAPITAVIFVREVILPRQRIISLGPIVIAAATAWLGVRALLGDDPVIAAPGGGPASLWVYAGLPVFAALVWGAAEFIALLWRETPQRVERAALRLKAPVWALPAAGGALLGALGFAFPQALGVGYSPLSEALAQTFPAALLLVLCLIKAAATAITVGFRFDGGLIAPALFVGATAGGGFGGGLEWLLPGDAGAGVFYAVTGMGAVAGAVMGAPAAMAVLVLEITARPDAAIASLACSYAALRLARIFAAGEARPAWR